MHKSQLMWDLVNRFGMTKKDAKLCVDTVFSSMSDTLAEQGRIEIRGFAMLRVKGYRSYRGRYPLKHLSIAIGKSGGNLRLAASKHNGGLGRRSLGPAYVAKVF